MYLTTQSLARLSDTLIIAGASSLFLTFLVGHIAGERTVRIVFAALVSILLMGVWLRLWLWERSTDPS